MVAAMVGVGAAAIAAAEVPEVSHSVGWPSLILAGLGGFALWRAGTVKAWKETAEGRAERIDDLEQQVGELRTELAIPERIEGIVRLMAETAERQDLRADRRAELVTERLERRLVQLEETCRGAIKE